MSTPVTTPPKQSPSRGSLYKETAALRQLATKQSPQMEEEEEPLIDIGRYVKIVLLLSGLSITAGLIIAALLH